MYIKHETKDGLYHIIGTILGDIMVLQRTNEKGEEEFVPGGMPLSTLQDGIKDKVRLLVADSKEAIAELQLIKVKAEAMFNLLRFGGGDLTAAQAKQAEIAHDSVLVLQGHADLIKLARLMKVESEEGEEASFSVQVESPEQQIAKALAEVVKGLGGGNDGVKILTVPLSALTSSTDSTQHSSQVLETLSEKLKADATLQDQLGCGDPNCPNCGPNVQKYITEHPELKTAMH